jgi:hypothetical protein
MILPDPRPYFAELEDPRRATKNKLHKLNDIFNDRFLCSSKWNRRLDKHGSVCAR